MKIVFINPSLRPEAKRRQLPVGLAYVMTAAQKAGFAFDLIDMDINLWSMDDVEEILSRESYDVYGIGCIVTGFRLVKKIAEIAKKINPKAIIIAGNSVASSIPDLLLNHTEVDVAVMGEGDFTIVDLLKALDAQKPLREVPGIAIRENGRVLFTDRRPVAASLDTIGFPDWRLFDLEKYNQYGFVNANCFSADNVLSYPLNSARGCPYHCTFCYHVFKGQRYRRYSEGAIFEEIERLHYDYGCDFVSFWDELTFPNIKGVEALLARLGKLMFKVGWEASVRGDLFTKEHIGLIGEMRALGCDNLAFSLENASPEILAAMKKHMNVPQFIEQAKALWAGGVTPLTSLVFGYPQETKESIEQTIKVCEECDIFPSVGFLLPLPGTPIYEWAKQNGRITDELEYLQRIGDRQDFHINLTAMSDAEFVGTVETKLRALAEKQGLKLESVFKTVTYQKPQK